MKRLHKRILTVCLALMMSVVMAVPAFAADEWKGISYCPNYWSKPSNNWLNVNRSSEATPASGCDLILWHTTTPGVDQKFNAIHVTVGSYSGYIIQFAATPNVAVNRRSSNHNAFLYPWNSTSNIKDSAFVYPLENIKLAYRSDDPYLSYASDTNLARVYFSTNMSTWDNG